MRSFEQEFDKSLDSENIIFSVTSNISEMIRKFFHHLKLFLIQFVSIYLFTLFNVNHKLFFYLKITNSFF